MMKHLHAGCVLCTLITLGLLIAGVVFDHNGLFELGEKAFLMSIGATAGTAAGGNSHTPA